MGIIQTDRWLKDEFDRPVKICKQLIPYFKGQKEIDIYNQLINYGMYRPSRSSKLNLDYMNEENLWEQTGRLLHHYKNKWSGPDVPIFLFPLALSRGFFMRQEGNKSGVSFPDKMFLFISQLSDIKELEALFVHEYHHVCRLSSLKKKMDDYTLLESIIIEGLAEYTVLKTCGNDYLAKWCKLYSEKEITFFWKKYLSHQLLKRKNERGHDELLYGGGRIPHLLGYAAGFHIVEAFYRKNRYSTKLSFTMPAKKYLEGLDHFSIESR